MRASYTIWLPISTLGDFGEKNRIYDFDLSSKLPSSSLKKPCLGSQFREFGGPGFLPILSPGSPRGFAAVPTRWPLAWRCCLLYRLVAYPVLPIPRLLKIPGFARSSRFSEKKRSFSVGKWNFCGLKSALALCDLASYFDARRFRREKSNMWLRSLFEIA